MSLKEKVMSWLRPKPTVHVRGPVTMDDVEAAPSSTPELDEHVREAVIGLTHSVLKSGRAAHSARTELARRALRERRR